MQRNLFTAATPSFWVSVQKLIGHLCAAGIIFLAFAITVWMISWSLDWLNGVHPYPKELYDLILKIEVLFTYGDIGLCIVVIAAGAGQFLGDMYRGYFR